MLYGSQEGIFIGGKEKVGPVAPSKSHGLCVAFTQGISDYQNSARDAKIGRNLISSK